VKRQRPPPDRAHARLTRWDEWFPHWSYLGGTYEKLAREALARNNRQSGADVGLAGVFVAAFVAVYLNVEKAGPYLKSTLEPVRPGLARTKSSLYPARRARCAEPIANLLWEEASRPP
jgi:hypothetical protein